MSDTTAPGRRSRRQAQAVDVEETQPVENVAGEISPYELPGPARRTNARKARRGYYAPKLPGAPSTTRQATVLNTALIGPSTGTQGVANGRDVLSHNLVTHDPGDRLQLSAEADFLPQHGCGWGSGWR